ncbi:DEAD/DEAH box helicase family protein [Coleofasciculus sp. FACHB-501]|uniref:DEAD/DEAH box helicase n=1 Tax=Cyanophyceae TaxID=3028117 RepID=UPI001685512E|nr:DEAD/DEAH box helicase family protein [Coleofasciculus sp. FACHB-501]MBD1837221.1 DEAD/DEAH box helicase family protein [Coleofasciculus sp. FACHB-501]
MTHQTSLPLTEIKPLGLRDYQLQVKQNLYSLIRSGKKRILVFAPTGAGKTVVAAQIVADAASRGRRVWFVVDLDILIAQTWDKFKKFGLDCGFVKAGWQEKPEASVQIVSAQTLARRGLENQIPPDVVLLDECHKTAWTAIVRQMMGEWCRSALYIGLTATPWRLSKRQGMGDIFDALVTAPMPHKLMDGGFLVKPAYYGIPGADLKGVRTVAGDFSESDLAIACDTSEVVERIVKEWLRLCQGRRTIVFAVNVVHSKHIRDAFLRAGIPSEHVDGTMTSKQRQPIYDRLAAGETLVVTSCQALQEGFDVPSVSAVLLCRPTKSRALYFQQIGRGLRIHPESEKTDCIVLDQAGNVKRFGFVEDLRRISLTEGSDTQKGDIPVKDCPDCEALLHISVMRCPSCGYEFPAPEKVTPTQKLERLLRKEDQPKFRFFREQVKVGFQKHYAPEWASCRFKEEYKFSPPDNWRQAAIFGDNPTDNNRLTYWNYLAAIAQHKGKPRTWAERQWRFEFGFDEEGGEA